MRVFGFITMSLIVHSAIILKLQNININDPIKTKELSPIVTLIETTQENPINSSSADSSKADATKEQKIIKTPTPETKPQYPMPAQNDSPIKVAEEAKSKKIVTTLPPKKKVISQAKQDLDSRSDEDVAVVIAKHETNEINSDEVNGALAPDQIRDARTLKQSPGNIPPEYPTVDRKNKKEGTTILLAYVTADGKINNIKIEKASGSKTLDASSFKAFANFKFFPGQEGWVRMPFKFEIKGQTESFGGFLRTTSI